MIDRKNTENETYYIIGKEYLSEGLFAIYIWICAQIIYAKQKGYIPVVDLKHYVNQLFKDNREFRDNVWEYFFEQPDNISLEDIPENAHIIIGGNKIPEIKHLWPGELPVSKHNQTDAKIADEYIKYFRLNTEMKEFLTRKYQEITNGNTNILGILCRGTDYFNTRPLNHPIQPTVKEVMQKAEELFKKYHYDKIWLATEDADIYETFKNKFGDKLLPNNQYKFSNTKNHLLYEISTEQKNHKFNLNKDYMLSMYILSKCKYFIGGKTSGTVAVYLFSNKFENQEYVYLWDKGCYQTRGKQFISEIFSIKNEYKNNIKYKVFTLLGIKLKLKHR